MSTINTNIVDYFNKIEELTNTNLNILKAINESFVTNKNNVSVNINDVTYTIPSCFSIENKLNSLQNTVDGFLNIPSTGEVWYNINGNTRALELKQYSCAPNALNLTGNINIFDVDNNNIFKELLTPMPVINFNLNIPNDIFEVKVRKIIAKSDNAKSIFGAKLNDLVSSEVKYSEIISLISSLNESDYEIYDKLYKLNTRTSKTGEGTYIIEDIINTYIDADGYDIYELKIGKNSDSDKNTLVYKKFDGLIVKPLKAGDFLRTSDGTGKVQITLVDNLNSIIKVKLITNDAINLIPLSKSNGVINEHSTLHYFNGDSIFSYSGKYESELKVSLEEDRYVFVCISSINSRLNTQSEWGNGVLIDTNKLKLADGTSFSDYYNDNVKNLGDALFEMSASLTSPISSINNDMYNTLIGIKPEITDELLRVVEINTHLKNKIYEETISSLDSLNTRYENALKIINAHENKMNAIPTIGKLPNRDLQNAIDVRDACQEEYTKFFETIDVNNILSYEPKYRIRGFIKPSLLNLSNIEFKADEYKLINDNININIIGMQIQYCYNDKSTLPESVSVFNDEQNKTYVYPIWVDAPTQIRQKKLKFENNKITYEYENNDDSANVKFNQIDIPINENESVKIRVRFIYDLGHPFNTITTDWSNSIDVKFDNSLLTHKNVSTIIDIANDNMLNIKANNIIVNSGIYDHIKYSQTKTGFVHHANTVDSGFRTSEQNIISLEQKLKEMSDAILDLQDIIHDDLDDLQVTVSVGSDNVVLDSTANNVVNLESYNSFIKFNNDSEFTPNLPDSDLIVDPDIDIDIPAIDTDLTVNGSLKSLKIRDNEYVFKNGVVSTFININLKNNGKRNIRLYSLFPGSRDVILNDSKSTFVNLKDYCGGRDSNTGVWIAYDNTIAQVMNTKLQTQNQFITFRINDAWNGTEYYSADAAVTTDNVQSSTGLGRVLKEDENALVIYPYLTNTQSLCLNNDNVKSYIIIRPGEEIVVPMYCEYVVSKSLQHIKKTISFDLRTSLYTEPINYSFTVNASNAISVQSILASTNRTNYWNKILNKIGLSFKS